MNKLLFLIFFIPIAVLSDTTANLLPQQFFNNNQEHNGWNCNDPSHNHGNNIVAARHGGFIENNISLSDSLTEQQIQGGWTSELGADIWHWYSPVVSETDMIQTITASDGTVVTQQRTVILDDYTAYATYTDSHIEGRNSNTDYNIDVRFNFRESSQSQFHRAVDLKNPTLKITYDPNPIFLNDTQTQEINSAVESIDTVNQFTEEIAPIVDEIFFEEISLELETQPEIMMSYIEDVVLLPDPIEEINTGVVEIFQEIDYEQTNIEEIATEIEIEEGFVESTENFSEISTEEIFEEINFAQDTTLGGVENNSIIETDSIGSIEELAEEIGGEITTAEISRDDDISETRIEEDMGFEESNEGTISERTPQEGEVVSRESDVSENRNESSNDAETVSDEVQGETNVASEEINETDRETETSNGEPGDEGTQVADSSEQIDQSESQEIEESRNDSVAQTPNQNIRIEDITKRVNEKIKRIDQRLVATSMLIAKVMQNKTSVEQYGQTNIELFNMQPQIDGGSYDETREYIDTRNLSSEVSYANNDVVQQYQKKVQEAIDNRIRAEEHLRRIRGY